MHCMLKPWSCAALALLALSAQAQPLTLQDAQRRAVERSRQVVAQDAAVLASREMSVAAGQLPDPVLKAGIDNLPVNGPAQPIAKSITVSPAKGSPASWAGARCGNGCPGSPI